MQIEANPVSLGRNNLSAAISLLTKAFHADPLLSYIFAVSVSDYERTLEELFRFSCEVRLLLEWPLWGWYSAEGTLTGVAGLSMPEEKPWPQSLEAVYNEFQACIGPAASQRIERYARLADSYRPKEPHYHLGFIGVHPQAQGQGYGRKLLDALQTCSEEHPDSIGVYLDTDSVKNVAIYERCGYRVLGKVMLEEQPIWCMFRDNRQ